MGDHSTHLIPLTKGAFAIVDAEDFEWLNQWKWCLHINGYAIRRLSRAEDPKRSIAMMHRVILGIGPGGDVDHIDGNKRNNSRSNLRQATRAQNVANRSHLSTSTSGYKGVYFHRPHSKWRAKINYNGKQIHLGTFEDKRAAAQAYNEAATKYFGEYAKLNEI